MRLWLWMWINARLCYHMLCVCDIMQVMQVICYMFEMLCKLCKPYVTCSWCYASYASYMLHDHDVMQVMQVLGYVFMMLVMQITMINIDPLWHHVMQVWCLIICKFIYDMLCKFGVWLYASNMCKFTPLYDMHTYASLPLCMSCIYMHVYPFLWYE